MSGSAQPSSDQLEPAAAAEEPQEMFDVRIPHIHAPHEDPHGWRGFLTHIAVVAIGLLLALGLEQGVEYVHHEIQRATLESQMQDTFRAGIRQADSNIRILDNYRGYLMDLRTAAQSRLEGGSLAPPKPSDPRNFPVAPVLNLGAYEAAKTNGSIALLGLNRLRLYSRIEFQHDLMMRSFQHYYDANGELVAFNDRFAPAAELTFQNYPDLAKLSPAQLAEYQTILANVITWNRMYEQQMNMSKLSYQMILRGTDNADKLTHAVAKAIAEGN